MIKIKAQTKRNAYSILLIGIISLFISLIIAEHFWLQAKLVLMFLITVNLITCFIGIIKILEPDVSFYISKKTLKYQHKYGAWQIPWSDIAAITQVSETVGIDKQILPYIGIRLSNLNNLIDNISPRLASRLIHEHRPLIHFAVQHQLLEIEDVAINFSSYKHQQREITGPTAAFLHQVCLLKKAFGYHLYLPESALDRSCDEFSILLNNCKHTCY
ncbi:MAG: DUF2982 domain-containing protein [Thalassotalea sp.]